MAALYDLFRTPQPKGESKVRYHARSVVTGKMDTDDLVHAIAQRSAFKEGVVTGVLVALEETEVTPLLFKTKGFQKMPVWDLVKSLTLPELLSWSDSRAFPMNAVITGTPPKQYVESMADLSDETVLGIKALNAEYTGEITVQYSYDGEIYTDEVAIADFLVMDLEVLYAGLLETKTITFRFWLAGDATLTTFIMNYRNGDDDDAEADGDN